MVTAPLEIGTTAPAFKTVDSKGATIDLQETCKSHEATVITFFRGTW